MDNNLLSIDSIRSVWNEEQHQWYYVVKDVVAFLSESINSADYIKKLRMRDSFLSAKWDTFVQLVPINTKNGFQKLNCTTLEGVFRLSMSISSFRAEILKRWLCSLSLSAVQGYSNPIIPLKDWYSKIENRIENPKLLLKFLSGKLSLVDLMKCISFDDEITTNLFLNEVVLSSLETPSIVGSTVSLETFLSMSNLPLKAYSIGANIQNLYHSSLEEKVPLRRGRKPKALIEKVLIEEMEIPSFEKDKDKKKKKKKKK